MLLSTNILKVILNVFTLNKLPSEITGKHSLKVIEQSAQALEQMCRLNINILSHNNSVSAKLVGIKGSTYLSIRHNRLEKTLAIRDVTCMVSAIIKTFSDLDQTNTIHTNSGTIQISAVVPVRLILDEFLAAAKLNGLVQKGELRATPSFAQLYMNADLELSCRVYLKMYTDAQSIIEVHI